MRKNDIPSWEKWWEYDIPTIDFSKIKRKKWEQVCRESYGIEAGKEYLLEILQDIKYEHIASWENGRSAKILIRLKKGTKLRWLAESNKNFVQLLFEDAQPVTENIRNQWERKFQRSVEDDNNSSFRIRSNKKKFRKGHLTDAGIIKIPASFFWTNFHIENGSTNVKITDSQGKIMEYVKNKTDNVVSSEAPLEREAAE